MAPAISTIWITDTAAMVGSIFHSRYWRMTIGNVVRPGPTRNRLISRLPNEVTKPNRAPATMPGRIDGRVIRQKVTQALAPRFWAASSMARSTPARLAVTRRTTQGMTITTCPATSA